jgi:hypothetical protein
MDYTGCERVEGRENEKKRAKGRKGVLLSTHRRFLAPPPMTSASERGELRFNFSFMTIFFFC